MWIYKYNYACVYVNMFVHTLCLQLTFLFGYGIINSALLLVQFHFVCSLSQLPPSLPTPPPPLSLSLSFFLSLSYSLLLYWLDVY